MAIDPTATEPSTDDGFPNYPGFGEPEDVLARIELINWIQEQIANGSIQVKAGDHVLATDGRILGVGEDDHEIYRRALEAEPALRNARLVGYDIPIYDR